MDALGNLAPEQAECQYESTYWPADILRRVITIFTGSLVGAGALAVLDQAIVSGTGFLSTVVIGRMCSKEDLGIYYLALNIVLIVIAVVYRAVMSPYTVYCGRRTGTAADLYAGSILAHHLALTLLSITGLLIAVFVLGLGVGAGLKPVLWILLVSLPLLLIRQFARDFAFAHLQLGRALAIDAAVAILQLGGLLVLARLGMLSVETAIAAMAVACAIASLGWFATKKQAFVVSREQLSGDWTHNWSFGRWALGSHFLNSAGLYVMPWLIVYFHGKTATGILAASWSLAGLANLFVTGIDNFLMPQAARAYISGGTHELRRVLRWAAAMFLATVGLITIAFLFFEEDIVSLTYGNKFSDIGPIVAIFMLSILIRSLGMVASNGLRALDQPQAIFVADVCTMVVALGSAVVLVLPMSVVGAAIAILAGAAVGTVIRGVLLRRFLNLASVEELT